MKNSLKKKIANKIRVKETKDTQLQMKNLMNSKKVVKKTNIQNIIYPEMQANRF